jgi:polyhydroxyalkanoate synthesis repressor PhaR
MRTIKRYSNRKLYDTAAKRYATLVDLASFIREGDTINVIDHTTSADLTTSTLAQIISMEEKLAPKLSSELLHKVIREGFLQGTGSSPTIVPSS